jgi:hypothetical protein
LTRRRTNVIFATVLLGMLLSALYQTIVSTALPTIVGDLGGGSHLTWVVSAYLLADTIATVLAAKFGDLFGRKLVFQVSAAASCSPRRPAGCPELERINERWPTIDETENAVVVLEVRTIPDVPSATLVDAFGRWSDQLTARGCRLILAGVDDRLAKTLGRSGLADRIGPENIFPAAPVLLASVDDAYETGAAWLTNRSGDT